MTGMENIGRQSELGWHPDDDQLERMANEIGLANSDGTVPLEHTYGLRAAAADVEVATFGDDSTLLRTANHYADILRQVELKQFYSELEVIKQHRITDLKQKGYTPGDALAEAELEMMEVLHAVESNDEGSPQ